MSENAETRCKYCDGTGPSETCPLAPAPDAPSGPLPGGAENPARCERCGFTKRNHPPGECVWPAPATLASYEAFTDPRTGEVLHRNAPAPATEQATDRAGNCAHGVAYHRECADCDHEAAVERVMPPPAPAADGEGEGAEEDWYARMYRLHPALVMDTHLPEECPMCLVETLQRELAEARREVEAVNDLYSEALSEAGRLQREYGLQCQRTEAAERNLHDLERHVATVFARETAAQRKLERDLATARAEVKRRDLALQSLTPGGSEFVNNPEECVAYANDRRNSAMEAAKKFKREANTAQRKLDALIAAVKCDVLRASDTIDTAISTQPNPAPITLSRVRAIELSERLRLVLSAAADAAREGG